MRGQLMAARWLCGLEATTTTTGGRILGISMIYGHLPSAHRRELPTCRSVLLSGSRRPSFCRVIRCPSRCARSTTRVQSAVPTDRRPKVANIKSARRRRFPFSPDACRSRWGTAMTTSNRSSYSQGNRCTSAPGRHRMVALVDTVVLEASTTELDDVVRLEDRYGR